MKKYSLKNIYINFLAFSLSITGIPINFFIPTILIYLKKKISYKKLILLVLITPFFLYSSLINESILLFYFSLIYFIIGIPKKWDFERKNKIYLLVTIISIIIQMTITLSNDANNRAKLIGYEYNFSGLMIFYLYLLSGIKKYRYIFTFFGILTGSRGFFISMLIREFLLLTRSKLTKFLYIIMYFIIILTIFISFGYVSTLDTNISGYQDNYMRLFQLIDTSTLVRVLTDTYLIQYIPDYIFQGIDSQLLVDNTLGNFIFPHNTLLQMSLMYGLIPTIIYFVVIIYSFSKNRLLRSSMLTLFIYCFTLHSVIQPLYIVLLHYYLKQPDKTLRT